MSSRGGTGQRYDVILTGRGLAPALSGALLSGRGRRVLIVEDRAASERGPEQEAFEREVGDSSTFLGLEPSGLLSSLLAELRLTESCVFELCDEVAQVLTPEFRLTISREEGELARDLRRELPEELAAPLERYLAAAKAAPIPMGRPRPEKEHRDAGDRKASRLLAEMPSAGSQTTLISSLITPLLTFCSHASPLNISTEQSIGLLALALKGVWRVNGGESAFIDRLYEKVRENGGTVMGKSSVESLVVEDDAIKGVLLSSYEGVVYADHVVLGARHGKIYGTLPDRMKDKNLLHDLSRVEPTHWRYSMLLSVDADGVPEGMASRVIHVADPSLPLDEENFLMIRSLPATQELKRGRKTARIIASALVPFKPSSLDYEYLRRLSGRMLRQLETVMPFIDFNILQLMPDFRADVRGIKECYPEGRLSLVPEHLHQYYVKGGKEQQTVGVLPVSTPHANLYFCGRTLWPAWGSYGEVLSAARVADAVTGIGWKK